MEREYEKAYGGTRPRSSSPIRNVAFLLLGLGLLVRHPDFQGREARWRGLHVLIDLVVIGLPRFVDGDARRTEVSHAGLRFAVISRYPYRTDGG